MSRILSLATLLGIVAAHVFPCAAADGELPAQIVFLHGGRDFALPQNGHVYQGLLARELMRQALLVAAREELGYATQDLHLGQEAHANALHVDIAVIPGTDKENTEPTRLELLRGKPPMQVMFAAETLETNMPIDLAAMTTAFEAIARGSFVKHLTQAGLMSQPRRWSDAAQPPADVIKLLAEMNFVSQFRAACALHGQISRDGQSAGRVAALARAYANLGVLTELHWSPAHEVFTARSLIYAQRLVASKREESEGLLSRAYAYALAGLHQAALDDLDTLNQLNAAKTSHDKDLAKVLAAYCRVQFNEFDPARCQLQNVELVRLLRCLAREQGNSSRQVMDELLEQSKSLPHCYRIQSSLAERAGVSVGHTVTARGPLITGATLYSRLSAIPGLPAAAKEAIPSAVILNRLRGQPLEPAVEIPAREKVTAALQGSDGSVAGQSELTWRVLGNLIADHSFLETYAVARFGRKSLGVPTDEWLDLAKPIYGRHTYAPVLDSFRSSTESRRQALLAAAKIDLDTIELQADALAQLSTPSNDPAVTRRAQQVHYMAVSHLDNTAADLSRRASLLTPERAGREAEILFRISPHSTAARNGMVAHHWNRVEPQLDAWLDAAKGDPAQLAALGSHYRQAKQLDRAIELFRQACDVSPELAHFRLLADTYRQQGKMEQWQATLEELLKHPDYALQHARVLVDIADYYVWRHEYEKALRFSRAAAENSYAAWALLSQAQCHEALQQWPEAEAIYRATADRYATLDWYYFTRRTGQGNSGDAQNFAQGRLARLSPLERGYVALAAGETKEAVKQLEAAYRQQPSVLVGLHFALVADELNDAAKRDAMLKALLGSPAAKSSPGTKQGLLALAEAISKDLASGGNGALDADTLEEAKRAAPSTEAAPFDYCLAKYLDLHGKAEAAKKIWLDRMGKNALREMHRTLSGAALLSRGVTPEAYKEALLTVVDAPYPPAQ